MLRKFRGLIVGLLVASPLAGCGQQQMAPGNRRLIESLRTAISSKRADWLDANAELIEKRHAAGQLSDEELQTFSSIIAVARSGDWAAAQKDVIALAKGQKALPERP